MPANARKTALAILNTWDREHRTLDLIVENALAGESLSHQDRRLATALVYGVFRWRGQLDWIIGQVSSTPLAKIDPPVLNILRLGVFQLRFLERIPDSAAVNTAVELAKTCAAPWTVRFVNGVLRSVIRQGERLKWPAAETDPLLALSVSKSFPAWLLKRWSLRFGPQETARLCDAMNTIPPITLRTNRLKTDRDALIQKLAKEVETIYATGHAPEGISLFGPGAPVCRLPGFEEGWFQVQDEAAQLATALVDPRPGETVLDACAGLGGKTGHLAQRMANRGRLIALDVSAPKLDRLKGEMTRLGATLVEALVRDLETPGEVPGGTLFDRILLDAPCSGLGVLRRNPDARWMPRKEDSRAYGERQLRFLNRLAPWVKPHGTLVYAVCTFERDENEAVIERFATAHPEFERICDPAAFPPEVRPFLDENGFFRTYPHRHGMDGFFAAALKRKG